MKKALIAVLIAVGAITVLWLTVFAGLATYDAVAGSGMDGMWDMMRGMGDGMGEMMDEMDGMMGGRDREETTGSAAGRGDVAIEDFNFRPSTFMVTVGTTVMWTNQDSAPHTATARDESFDTGRLDQDQSAEVTFETAGTFEYFCEFHPSMEGRVVVRS